MTATRDKLLVLGAGPLGLGVAKALREAGLLYDQVEASDGVGGNWRHGVYETAHIISSRKTTEFPDFPMPESYPDFPSAAQMLAYYESYADAFELRPASEFHAKVTAVRPRSDELWDVTLEKDGGAEQRVYKGVFLCNGHHWDKRWPEAPGTFSGELLHSKDYKRPDQLRGKRVLVVGGGNSGCDLICEAARVGAAADWSLRRGYWFLPKTVFGVPTVELMKGWTPRWLQRLLIRALVRVTIGDYRSYGLPKPDHKIFETHPSVSSEIFHYLKHGRIRPRPDLARYDGRIVHFRDGSSGQYDLVVCATGFHLSFPFLPPGLVEVEGPVAKVLGGALVPGYKHLYVYGTGQVRYGIGPVVRPLAQMMAAWAAAQDRMELPLGSVLQALGAKPPRSHLVDPHAAIRQCRAGRRMTRFLLWRERRLRRRGSPGGGARRAATTWG